MLIDSRGYMDFAPRASVADATALGPNRSVIEAFLSRSVVTGNLVSIAPDGGGIRGQWFGSAASGAAWVANENEAGRNVYWTVNATAPFFSGKPSKAGITAARFAHVDIDPPKVGVFDRSAALAALTGFLVRPSFTINSGNGYQGFWRLDDASPELDRVELVNQRLAQALGGDACHNIDRLMRLPGTVNYPNAKKAAASRVPAMASIEIEDAGCFCSIEALEDALPSLLPKAAQQRVTSSAPAAPTAPSIVTRDPLARLGIEPSDKLAGMIAAPAGADRSADAYAVACEMVRRGFDSAEISAVLLDRSLAISTHCLAQHDAARAATRAIDKARETTTAEKSGATGRGRPSKSQKSQQSLSQLYRAEDGWAEMSPLQGPDDAPSPYPVEALPSVLEGAVREYQAYGQQPMGLVACAAIGNLALAAQGRANVARDHVLTGPISLSFMLIADSGERKTTVDRFFGAEIRAWERDKKNAAAPEIADHAVRQRSFDAKMDGKKQALTKAAAMPAGKGDVDCKILEAEMLKLEAERPIGPRVPQLYYEDVTIETLLRDIAAGWPSASWWSDEGGMIVGGHSFSDEKATYSFACINRLWDGNDVPSRSRITTGSFEIRGRRLTVSFAFQNVVLQQLLGTGNGASRGTGFLARFLMARPESTMGQRLYREPPIDLPRMQAYREMIHTQLQAGVRIKEGSEDYEIDPPLLQLLPTAKAAWIAYFNATEVELHASGAFADVKDFASKSADNAVRLAALFHLAGGGQPDGLVSVDDMERGCTIARWHLGEARRIMGAQLSPEFLLANQLLHWIIDKGGRVRCQIVLKDGPSKLRTKAARDAAASILADHGIVRRERTGVDATEYFQVHPDLMPTVH